MREPICYENPDDCLPVLPNSELDFRESDPVVLRDKLSKKNDDYLRLAAEFDNFKKFNRKDTQRQAAAEKEAFIQELLPVLDNLGRALSSGQSEGPLHQGVEMTLQQLTRLLHENGIYPVEDLGLPFDPHRHDAVSVRHDASHPDNIILEVVQRGYCSGDKLFRPALVIVNDLSDSTKTERAS